MANRQSDAPSVYPLGHPRNPKTAAKEGPAPRRVPTPQPDRKTAGAASTSTSTAPAAQGDTSTAPAPAKAEEK